MTTEQLEQMLRERGAIARLKTEGDRVVVVLYWMPPAAVAENMRPFTSAMPGAFIRDLRGNGFEPVPAGEQPRPDYTRGVFAGAWESEGQQALHVATGLADMHGIECRPFERGE